MYQRMTSNLEADLETKKTQTIPLNSEHFGSCPWNKK